MAKKKKKNRDNLIDRNGLPFHPEPAPAPVVNIGALLDGGFIEEQEEE